MNVSTISRPSDAQFARVDRVKVAAGQEVLPGDDRNWILGEPLVVDVGDGEVITVPSGFTTDGASIPNAVERLTVWRPFEGPQRWAGIAHDWLYYQDGYDRKRAAEIFRALLRTEGASWFRTMAMYWSVRAFDKWAYDANQARVVEDRIWGNPAYPRHVWARMRRAPTSEPDDFGLHDDVDLDRERSSTNPASGCWRPPGTADLRVPMSLCDDAIVRTSQ